MILITRQAYGLSSQIGALPWMWRPTAAESRDRTALVVRTIIRAPTPLERPSDDSCAHARKAVLRFLIASSAPPCTSRESCQRAPPSQRHQGPCVLAEKRFHFGYPGGVVLDSHVINTSRMHMLSWACRPLLSSVSILMLALHPRAPAPHRRVRRARKARALGRATGCRQRQRQRAPHGHAHGDWQRQRAH